MISEQEVSQSKTSID